MGKRTRRKKISGSSQSGGPNGGAPNDGGGRNVTDVISGSGQPIGSSGQSSDAAVDETDWRKFFVRDRLNRGRYMTSLNKGVHIDPASIKVMTNQERPGMYLLEFNYTVFSSSGWLKILFGPELPKFTDIICLSKEYEKESSNESIYSIYKDVTPGIRAKLH